MNRLPLTLALLLPLGCGAFPSTADPAASAGAPAANIPEGPNDDPPPPAAAHRGASGGGVPALALSACVAEGTVRCGSGRCLNELPACSSGRPTVCVPKDDARVAETCNGIDDDCDGEVDEGLVCVPDAHCDAPRVLALSGDGTARSTLSLHPGTSPAQQPCGDAQAAEAYLALDIAETAAVAVLTAAPAIALVRSCDDARPMACTDDAQSCGERRLLAQVLPPGRWLLRVGGPVGIADVEVQWLTLPRVVAVQRAPMVSQALSTSDLTGDAAGFPTRCGGSGPVDVVVRATCPLATATERRYVVDPLSDQIAAWRGVQADGCVRTQRGQQVTLAVPRAAGAVFDAIMLRPMEGGAGGTVIVREGCPTCS